MKVYFKKANSNIERDCGRFISFLALLDLVHGMTKETSRHPLLLMSMLLPFFLLSAIYPGLHVASALNNTSNTSNTTNTSNRSNLSTDSNNTNSTTDVTNTTNSVPLSSPTAKSPTDGKSVDVMVQASPFPLAAGDSKFKISFLQHSSETVQVHVDYDVAISQLGKEVFRASALTGQPLLHTAEGIVTIPYKFENPGHYTIQVSVLGINFIPIKTETVKFDFDVK